MPQKQIKIVHIISTLIRFRLINVLYNIVKYLDRDKFDVSREISFFDNFTLKIFQIKQYTLPILYLFLLLFKLVSYNYVIISNASMPSLESFPIININHNSKINFV